MPIRRFLLLGFAFFILIPQGASAEVARLFSGEGTVEVRRSSGAAWSALAVDAPLDHGDAVRTGDLSKAAVLFSDGVIVRIDANSALDISASGNDNSLSLSRGKAYLFSRTKKNFPVIKTPVVSAAIRGTEIEIEVKDDQSTTVSLLEGSALLENAQGRTTLAGGERAEVVSGSAPQKELLVKPLDSVQWTFRLPYLFPLPSDSKIQQALSKDDLQAFRDLKIGAQAGSLNGTANEQGSLLALQALIAVIKNEPKRASELYKNAIQSSPQLVAGYVVGSLAEQSSRNLEVASALIDSALKLSPNDAYLLARSAELALGREELEEAQRLVAQARNIAPTDPYPLVIEGFVNLMRNQNQDAESSFRRASELDRSYALALLGLGLSTIRQGDLAGGREKLALAAAMEPQVAIYRSYLGKAFFEEEKEDLAGSEYERAIALDPEDPTPYLYRAYNALSQNDPVSALSDVETSIAKNDNRAVYRSSLQLDSDSAVRSAGLAEVFNTLGFSQTAKVEAIKSLSKDYSNYAAHRLLGDSYQSAFFVDARISELKVADLLSPLSLNLLERSSGEPSLNEYNSFFERPQTRQELDLLGATQGDRLAPAYHLSGRTEHVGYFFGYDSAYGGGRKDDHYSRDHRVRGVGQYQLSYEDRIILDSGYQYQSAADTDATFDDTKLEGWDVNLGYNHKFGPNSYLISQLSYLDNRDSLAGLDTRPVDVTLHSAGLDDRFDDLLYLNQLWKEDRQEFRGSLQATVDGDSVSFIAGGQVYSANSDRKEKSSIIDDEFGIFPGLDRYLRSEGDNSLNSQDGYLYSIFHVAPWLDLTGGMDYTHLETESAEIAPFVDETRGRSRWNPKAGATAFFDSGTTVRAAYFESLRKSALEDVATLEPTIVGGINQRFSDFSGTRSKNFGVGVDQKFQTKTYIGADWTKRKVSEPASNTLSALLFDFDSLDEDSGSFLIDEFNIHQDQDIATGYIYQVLSERFVATLEGLYSKFDDTDSGDLLDIETEKVAGGIRYFDPSGFFGFTEATWRNQDRRASLFVEDGESDFWLVDAGVGYRIPKRHGSVLLKFLNIFDNDFTYDQSLGVDPFISQSFGVELRAVVNF